jgi:DNA-binding XRE family transcriptional regulator
MHLLHPSFGDMNRNRTKKIDAARTSFARWRALLALTQAEAAEKLGKSRRTVADYERKGVAVTPDHCTRVVMQLLAHGAEPPEAWPE